MVYLDYAAHTPADPAVLDAYCRATADYIGNPNSSHALGASAAARIAEAGAHIAALLGCGDMEVIYTSGATEANNLAILGGAGAYRENGRRLVTTALEHSSVSACFTALQQKGWEVDLAPVGADGRVRVPSQAPGAGAWGGTLRELIRQDTVMVSVCAVDGELGVVQPIREIGALIKSINPDCLFHVDGTQLVGKLPGWGYCGTSVPDTAAAAAWDGFGAEGVCDHGVVSPATSGVVPTGQSLLPEGFFRDIDLFSFAPHKCYGLGGMGVLLRKPHVALEPQLMGGKSTGIYRSGTPVVAHAAATERALELAAENADNRWDRVCAANARLRAFFGTFGYVHINNPTGKNDLPAERSKADTAPQKWPSSQRPVGSAPAERSKADTFLQSGNHECALSRRPHRAVPGDGMGMPGALPHFLNISIDGYRAEDAQRLLSEAGVCVSTKSACSSPKTPSRIVYNVSQDKKRARGSIRISISHLTTEEDIERFMEAFRKCFAGSPPGKS
ncbi:MAG: aminotransferase class V-fold PLP-dependent enzyme [Lachnospiraceae bacterium]|jgi:cysteine desulfurase|nr:aminotransferase class V-fold PLP-dependent enzyme [Lachnospiraceae bacterium]